MRCMDDGGRKESRTLAERLLVLGLDLGQQGRPLRPGPALGWAVLISPAPGILKTDISEASGSLPQVSQVDIWEPRFKFRAV